MKTAAQVTWNTATKWGSHAINGVIGVLLVPFLLNELGKEGYGLIALVGVILSLTGLADLGLRQGLGRNLAEAVARRDNLRFNELASTAMVVYIAIGFILSGVIIAAAPYIIKIFKAPPALTLEAIFLVRWYGSASLMTAFINPVAVAVFISHNRYDIANNIITAVSILRGIGLFCVLGLTDTGLYGWGYVFIAVMVLATAFRLYIAYHFKPDLQIHPRHFRMAALRQIFSLGSQMFVIEMATLISVQVDPLIITQFFGPAGVSIYRPGRILALHSRELVNAFRSQLSPLTTGYNATGNIAKLQEILVKATRYSTLMAAVVCVMLVVFAEPIMKVWIGKTAIGDHYKTAAVILIWMAVNDLLVSTTGSQWAVLFGMNRLGFLVWTATISGTINLLSSIYLVGYTSLGVTGVVIPTAVLSAVRRPIVASYTAWLCQLSPWRYICETYTRPLIVLLLVGMVAVAARFTLQPDSIIGVAACLAITGAAWCPLSWFIGLEVADQRIFLNLVKSFRGKIPRS
jgi:O-antigen/teichoic acid export membrane protein